MNKTNNSEGPKSSLRNNILIAFFLIVTLTGISLTIVYQNLFLSELSHELVDNELVQKIGRYSTAVSSGFILIGIVVSGIIAIFLSNSITRQIKKLTEGVEQIRQGNLDVTIDIPSQDEFCQFAETLNDMLKARREAESALHQKIEELCRSNAELERYASVASHDLQEPLRLINSYLQVLSAKYKDKLDSQAHHFISRAMYNATRMSQLINDLLMYSQATSQHEHAYEKINCSDIIHTIETMFQYTIKEINASITCDLLPVITADQTQITQLFQNLIGNALKFHTEKPPQVHVSAKKEGSFWVFSVRDNGIGIDPKYAERIFTMFERLHTHSEYDGTGIGLAICKKIVKQYGGRIWVESQPDQGSTFFFTFPSDDSHEV